jgi:hypothetical protein
MNSLLLGLALTVGAPAIKEKEKPPAIAGEWEVKEFTTGGQPPQITPPGRQPRRWVFRADGTRVVIFPDGREAAQGKYSIDSKASTMDFEQPLEAGGDIYPCRFKLDGDTLIVNVGWPEGGRPAGLESPRGSKCTLYVMKRVKPTD